MAISAAQRAEQLDFEQRLLVKADQDIAQGLQRLHEQTSRVHQLRVGGHDTAQAERLVDLLEQTLTEWERHRTLIQQRVVFLQDQLALERQRDG